MESKDWSGFGYFSPDFSPGMPCHRGFEPPADSDPRPNSLADMDPLPNVPFKHRLYHIWLLILFTRFLLMFFSITRYDILYIVIGCCQVLI